MCGLVGIIDWTSEGPPSKTVLERAVESLAQRGPDYGSTYFDRNVALGHRRLSIIDTSASGNQPMSDPSGRYTLVFNGEFYNYREHRDRLAEKGIPFTSSSDTEVLLAMLMHEGAEALPKINGFFALALYDKQERTVFLARDRFGIKPLLIFHEPGRIVFGSEMKALMAAGIKRELDRASLFTYLQLHYVPGPATMLHGVEKMPPGHHATIRIDHPNQPEQRPEYEQYYAVAYDRAKSLPPTPEQYTAAKSRLQELLDTAVQRRLVSDVPLGAFLSGGIDSSVLSTIAARHQPDLQTFSIGYANEPFFDETEYARAVAKNIGTRHTVFSLSNDDLWEHLHGVLNYIDEPFADSSALPVFILSHLTRKEVTVAISGDGADEIFTGYNKHAAEFKARNPGVMEKLVGGLGPVWETLPQGRNSKLGNLNRKLQRFSEGVKLPPRERYWRWASWMRSEEANYLLRETMVLKSQRLSDDAHRYKKRRDAIVKTISPEGNINEVLLTDVNLVLTNDMLHKVDSMSMANSLEVRVPFLDHEVVDFAFSLPPSFKINGGMRKKILQDTFRDLLPAQLYNRPKQGFEVPLLNWFRNEMRSTITDDLLSPELIEEQGIFNPEGVQELVNEVFSNNPGDSPSHIWTLVVFQHWWKKYLQS